MTDVQDVLLPLDGNKATGPDKIPAKLLKCCAPYICSSLPSIFYKSLSLHVGTIPSDWKLSNVIPILKNGTANHISNYRRISLLPIASKAMECCVYNKIIDHVSSQLHCKQIGFLKKSTTSQLLQVLQVNMQLS